MNNYPFFVTQYLQSKKEIIEKLDGVWTGIGYIFPERSPQLEEFAKEQELTLLTQTSDDPFEKVKKEYKIATMTEMAIQRGHKDKKLEENIKKKEEEEKFAQDLIDEMNAEWAIVKRGAEAAIINTGGKNDEYYAEIAFNRLYKDQKFEKKAYSQWWLCNPGRKVFEKVVFDTSKPPNEFEENGLLFRNLWRGLALQPVDGDCSIILKHFLDVICAGEEAYFDFLMKILAMWVQKPWKKTLCPVLRSQQGTGKKVLPDLLGRIFGNAFCSSSNHSHIFGQFNALIENKVVIELNEAMFGGDKQLSGALKAAITEDTMAITRKGKDPYIIKNQKKFFIVSNEEFAIPADRDARRFLFLDVSDCKKGDKEYFDELYGLITKGKGANYFLHYLNSLDIENFDHRNLPEFATKFGFSNKLQSSDSFLQYLYDALNEGYFDLSGDIGDEGNYWCADGFNKDVVYKCYEAYCNKSRRAFRTVSRTSMGIHMVNIFGKGCILQIRSGEDRGQRKYVLGSLENAKQKFAKFFNSDNTIFE